MKKILTIIGARPQIIKASAISRCIADKFGEQLEEIIVHTGQHYDPEMSEVFFKEMNIPRPKFNLHSGSGTHGRQTGKMIESLESLMMQEKPDAVLVYGDTNSTIAGALAAVKLLIPVVHVEAGLRSFNKRMPEEINRIATDHMSTLLFAPTDQAIENLLKEGFSTEQKTVDLDHPGVFKCGDIMYDNSLHFSALAEHHSSITAKLGLTEGNFILCTIHRDSNTDHPERLTAIFRALNELSLKHKTDIVLPIHPRTKNAIANTLDERFQQELFSNEHIKIIDPVGFFDIITLERDCKMVITDSGGLQKEAYFFRKCCVILREQTEWVEIVEQGKAILADANIQRITDAYDVLSTRHADTFPAIFGDGNAAEFICSKISELL